LINTVRTFYTLSMKYSTYAPETVVTISKNEARRKAKPWINKEIIKLIKSKDKTYKKFINEKKASTKDQLFNQYKQQKNEVTKSVRNSKKAY